ncbi:MAG: hypothetical protein JWR65_4753 [Massilia sp.]|jgi:hypothetical protein|nr:hypothetical protein [Massilia sp.]
MLAEPNRVPGKKFFTTCWRNGRNAVRITAAELRQTLGVLQVANAMRG